MTDLELLQSFIDRSGVSYTNIAKALGLTYMGLRNKLTGKREFTLREAIMLKSILGLTRIEWDAVFNMEE